MLSCQCFHSVRRARVGVTIGRQEDHDAGEIFEFRNIVLSSFLVHRQDRKALPCSQRAIWCISNEHLVKLQGSVFPLQPPLFNEDGTKE